MGDQAFYAIIILTLTALANMYCMIHTTWPVSNPGYRISSNSIRVYY